MAAEVVTLVRGMDDCQEFVPASLVNGHTTEKIRRKYSKYIHWKYIPSEVVFEGYKHPDVGQVDENISLRLEKGLTDPLHFPLMAESLEGTPPTLVITCESDTIRDDGYLYVRRLREERIPVYHLNSKGGFHGMLPFFDTLSAAEKIFINITGFIGNHVRN